MDDELLERLLQAPESAGAEASGLAAMLAAASTYPSAVGSQPGEEAALVAFRNRAMTAPSRRKLMLGKALAAKSLAAFAVGTLTLGGGVALADSTGVAPSGLGSAINNVVPFPGNGHHYGTIKHHGHPGADNSTNQTGQDNANKPDDPSNGADAHGQAVSGIAKSASPGPGHGAAVSKVARDRHGQGQPDVETSKGPGQNDATEHQNDAPDAQESEAPEPSETEPSETDAPETEAPGISSGRPAVPGAGHSHG